MPFRPWGGGEHAIQPTGVGEHVIQPTGGGDITEPLTQGTVTADQ